MALPPDAENLLLNEGFFFAEDASLGDDISELERRGFPYYSEYGLEFCSQYVLNEVSRENIWLELYLIVPAHLPYNHYFLRRKNLRTCTLAKVQRVSRPYSLFQTWRPESWSSATGNPAPS